MLWLTTDNPPEPDWSGASYDVVWVKHHPQIASLTSENFLEMGTSGLWINGVQPPWATIFIGTASYLFGSAVVSGGSETALRVAWGDEKVWFVDPIDEVVFDSGGSNVSITSPGWYSTDENGIITSIEPPDVRLSVNLFDQNPTVYAAAFTRHPGVNTLLRGLINHNGTNWEQLFSVAETQGDSDLKARVEAIEAWMAKAEAAAGAASGGT